MQTVCMFLFHLAFTAGMLCRVNHFMGLPGLSHAKHLAKKKAFHVLPSMFWEGKTYSNRYTKYLEIHRKLRKRKYCQAHPMVRVRLMLWSARATRNWMDRNPTASCPPESKCLIKIWRVACISTLFLEHTEEFLGSNWGKLYPSGSLRVHSPLLFSYSFRSSRYISDTFRYHI